ADDALLPVARRRAPARLPARRRRTPQGPPGGAVSLEFTRRALSIPFYPAAETYKFEGELVKLASNETPWAPHAAVMEAVEASLRDLNRYPDPTASKLRHRIADRYGVPVSGVAVGNGSCDILLAAAEAMLEPDAEIV